jgi:hypothetical protein
MVAMSRQRARMTWLDAIESIAIVIRAIIREKMIFHELSVHGVMDIMECRVVNYQVCIFKIILPLGRHRKKKLATHLNVCETRLGCRSS